MNFQRILQHVFSKLLQDHRILILMKYYGLEESEQIEQVWGLHVGAGFSI